VPVNTKATVYLAVNDAAKLFVNGIRNITYKVKNGDASIEIGSGKYVIVVKE
jgi:hypothetical protein